MLGNTVIHRSDDRSFKKSQNQKLNWGQPVPEVFFDLGIWDYFVSLLASLKLWGPPSCSLPMCTFPLFASFKRIRATDFSFLFLPWLEHPFKSMVWLSNHSFRSPLDYSTCRPKIKYSFGSPAWLSARGSPWCKVILNHHIACVICPHNHHLLVSIGVTALNSQTSEQVPLQQWRPGIITRRGGGLWYSNRITPPGRSLMLQVTTWSTISKAEYMC